MAEDLRTIGQLLAEIGVPPQAFSLGRPSENAWCVVPVDSPPSTPPAYDDEGGDVDEVDEGVDIDDEPDPVRPSAWEVYRLAGGEKQRLTVVSTEEAACDVLLGELGFGQRSWP